MKTLITIVLCTLSSILFIRAQSYVPFPEQNAVWSNFISDEGQQGKGDGSCSNSNIYTNGDTIINGKKYIKLLEEKVHFIHFGNICHFSPDTTKPVEWSSFGFLRNDTVNKKVYYRKQGTNSDTLLYTFDLNIGDTLPRTYINHKFNQNNTFVGYIVDSVFIESYGGVNRKVFVLNKSGSRQYTLIEGIGSVRGLFSYRSTRVSTTGNYEYNLNCLTVNNQLVYGSSGANCQLTSINELDNKQSGDLNVYPNPVKNQFKIETTQRLKIKEIELFDLTGKSVRIYNSNQLEFSVKGITPGVYILRIEETNKLYTKKLIVQ